VRAWIISGVVTTAMVLGPAGSALAQPDNPIVVSNQASATGNQTVVQEQDVTASPPAAPVVPPPPPVVAITVAVPEVVVEVAPHAPPVEVTRPARVTRPASGSPPPSVVVEKPETAPVVISLNQLLHAIVAWVLRLLG
jgi:hypothetical protein